VIVYLPGKKLGKNQPAAVRPVPLSRPPLERMLRIHQAIHAGEYPNATTLGRQLEVSTKSIHRDLEFMRDRLELPLEYDPRKAGYYYTQEVSGFPTLQLTEGELFSLLIAEKALEQYRGTSFEKPLISALNKLASALPDTISLNWEDWNQTISFRTTAEAIVPLEVFDALAKATSRRQQLNLHYRKAGSKTAEPRMVDPYHLANINGEWFLFAYCHLRRDIRTFVPARIETVQFTGKSFSRPESFSLKKRLRDSFGVYSGSKTYAVVIRFTEWAADFVREKRWHASQELRELKDGGVELHMTLSSLLEVQRWVLSWGGDARVLQPPELAAAVQTAARRLLDRSAPAR
jgi:predicted DNA-binding transcriptional regulator YafY